MLIDFSGQGNIVVKLFSMVQIEIICIYVFLYRLIHLSFFRFWLTQWNKNILSFTYETVSWPNSVDLVLTLLGGGVAGGGGIR